MSSTVGARPKRSGFSYSLTPPESYRGARPARLLLGFGLRLRLGGLRRLRRRSLRLALRRRAGRRGRRRVRRRLVDRHELRHLVDPRLRGGADRVLVAEYPDVVEEPIGGVVVLVAGLEGEEVVGERRRDRVRTVHQEKRREHAVAAA